MREHEVPTHVQAEDKVLLGLTFPQIVAVTAVCAIGYGIYTYAPFDASEVRIAAGVVFALAGIAATAGRIGGRRLPLVAADLLRYRIGPRVFVGSAKELVRAENPEPPLADNDAFARLKKMIDKAYRAARGPWNRRRSGRRMPFRPKVWLRARRIRARAEDKRRLTTAADKPAKKRRLRFPRAFLVIAAVTAAALASPFAAVADGGEDDAEDGVIGWTSPEIDFQPPLHVPGRRVFVEKLEVTDNTATVGVRAAYGLELGVRAFRGSEDPVPVFHQATRLALGAAATFEMPIAGTHPSFVFSWKDDLGQSGAVAIEHDHLPHPLPAVEGELCDIRVRSLRWTPGAIDGVVESECVRNISESFELTSVTGHVDIEQEVVLDAVVEGISGTLAVDAGSSFERVPFLADGETVFRLPAGSAKELIELRIVADMLAELSVPVPPLVQLTHHPERIETVTGTVPVPCPGASEKVTKSFSIFQPDGTETQETVSSRISIPSREIEHEVSLPVVHPEHIKAEVVERAPERRRREEQIAAPAVIASDDPYAVLVVPPPPPPPDWGRHEPAARGRLGSWFDRLGWVWPW